MRWWTVGGLLVGFSLSTGCKSTGRPIERSPPAAAAQSSKTAIQPASHEELAAPAETPSADPLPIAPEPLPPPMAEAIAAIETIALDDAVAIGLRNNPRLRQMSAQSWAARARADVAYAPFLPEVNGGFRFADFNSPVIPGGSFVPASLPTGVDSFTLAEIGVQYTIYDFGRRAGHYDAAVYRSRSQDLARARAIQTVAYEVVQSYLKLLSTQAIVQVRQEALRDARRILDDTRARLEGGVVDRDAVLRAQVELSQAQQYLLSAFQAVHDARARLNVTMGLPPLTEVRLVEVLSRPDFHRTAADCLQEAIVSRREIGMGRAAVAEAQSNLQAAHADKLPRVYVRSTAVQANSPGPLNGAIEGVGIHVDQPFYAGGRYQNEVRYNYAQVAAAMAGLQVIVDNVSLQVVVAVQAIDTDRQRIELAETAVTQARENLRLLTVRYQNGNATPTDIVDAETALVQTQTSYYTAVFGYLEGLSRLEFALGNDQNRLLAQLQLNGAAQQQPTDQSGLTSPAARP